MAHSTTRPGAGLLRHQKSDRLQPRTLGGTDPLSRRWRSADRQQSHREPNTASGPGQVELALRRIPTCWTARRQHHELIQSAKLNGHDLYRYLKDVLERLPTHPASRIKE